MNELLISILNGKKIHSARAEYYCSYADNNIILFARTNDTGKILIPTGLAEEWIRAYEHGLIKLDMTSREMRNIVQKNSDWAAYQHGFETHMHAIVKTWADSHNR
jgi:hypothetical protein